MTGPTTPTNPTTPTFRPNQQLGDSWNVGSLFGGGGGGSAPAVGPVAYAPVQNTPVYNNRNFDSLGTPTFNPTRQLTVDDILNRLSANTPRERTVVTAADLSGDVTSGGFGRTIASMSSNLFSPIADFVGSAFSPAPAAEEIAAFAERNEILRDQAVSFEDRFLKLDTLELMLAPGDPREVFDRLEDIAKSVAGRPHNPFLDGVLVRTRPWDTSEGSLSGYFGLGSDSYTYDENAGVSSGARGAQEGVSDPIRESFDAKKPAPVFSAMKLTMGTISQAISDLFKNVFTTLLWWL